RPAVPRPPRQGGAVRAAGCPERRHRPDRALRDDARGERLGPVFRAPGGPVLQRGASGSRSGRGVRGAMRDGPARGGDLAAPEPRLRTHLTFKATPIGPDRTATVTRSEIRSRSTRRDAGWTGARRRPGCARTSLTNPPDVQGHTDRARWDCYRDAARGYVLALLRRHGRGRVRRRARHRRGGGG